jgi:hypothetical protein
MYSIAMTVESRPACATSPCSNVSGCVPLVAKNDAAQTCQTKAGLDTVSSRLASISDREYVTTRLGKLNRADRCNPRQAMNSLDMPLRYLL